MNAKRFAFLTAFTWAASCVFGHAVLTEPVGTSSATQTATVTITTAGTLQTISVLTQGAIGLDFNAASGGTCSVGHSYAVGNTCTVNYTFKPTRPWIRYGGIALADSSGGLLGNTYVTGTGTGPQPIFPSNSSSTILVSRLGDPQGVAVDGSGDVYVADYYVGIREIFSLNGSIPPNPTVKVAAYAFYPWSVALDGSGNLYYASDNGEVIEIVAVKGKIVPGDDLKFIGSGWVTPRDVVVDGSGNVYVTDPGNTNPLQEVLAVNGVIPANPTVRVLGGGKALASDTVAVDGSGNVYVVVNGSINELVAVNGSIPSNPTIRTLGGGITNPGALGVDGAGNIYVTLGGNSEGLAEILAVNGSIPDNPTIRIVTTERSNAVAVDATGNVYFAHGGEIVELNLSDPPSLSFAPTMVGETSSDSPQSVTVGNSGNAALTGALSISPNWDQVAGSGTPEDCAASFSLAPSAECNLSLSFEPTEAGTLTGAATLTDNALNVAGATQQIPLSGIGEDGQLSVSATALAFGNLALGQQKDLSLQVTNTGAIPVTFSPSINGPSFTVPSSENGCGTVIPAGHSCTFSVRFLPRTYGGHTDTLTLAAPQVQAPTVQLTGQTLGVGAEIGLLDFGTIPSGTTATLNVPMVNYGVSQNVIFGASTNVPSFIIPPSGNTCLAGVTASQQCVIPVEFSPAAVGSYEGLFTIIASSGDVSLVTLKGTASQP
jgi:sugar lactone lactonase YvrE